MTGAVKDGGWWVVGGEVLLMGSGGIWELAQLPLLVGEPREEGCRGSGVPVVGEARHGYSHGPWANATGHRAHSTGHSGMGPTSNPVCTSSGTVKTAPARKEGAVGRSGLRIQNAGCHFTASAGSNASQRLPCPRLIALQAGRLSPDDCDLVRSQGTTGRCPRQS